MLDTPLVQTLQSLSQAEARSFRKFLESPFFNQREDVVRLFDHLLSKKLEQKEAEKSAAHPSRRTARPPDWGKEAAFRALFFGGRTGRRPAAPPVFDDARMRYVMSFLFVLLKKWLALSEWSADGNAVNLATCRALKKRGLAPVFEKELRAGQRALAAATGRGNAFFDLEYRFALENWEHSRQKHRAGDEATVEAMGVSFGAFVALTILRQGCAAVSRQTVGAGGFELPFLEETLARVERGGFAEVPVVQLYYCAYLSLKRPGDTENFGHFTRLLNEQSAALSPSELHELWTVAINFSIRRLNSGDRGFMRGAFELYRTGLERRIIMEDGAITKFTWKNVLKIGLGLGETDWCRRFLDEYKPFLPAAEREATWRLGLASWYFGMKDYDSVLETLRDRDFRDPLANLDARRMVLRIYFERGEMAALESLLDSFRTYLRRHRADIGYHRESFQNLVGFVRRLVNLEAGDDAKRAALREEILAAQFLAEREWLLGLFDQTK